MNINRNNYEEYFLLYADKELSALQENIVEKFVKENTDLEEEFLMLLQSVVKPDKTIVLPDKKFLFKTPEFISKNNYEEIFVLLNDNELSATEIEETEVYIKENNNLISELALLQKAKLQPDTSIVFPGKKLLYRKENDNKVVPLKWWKAMAAAVILGFGLWFGIIYLQKDKAIPAFAVSNNKPDQSKKPTIKPINTRQQAQTTQVQNNVVIKETVDSKPAQTGSSIKNLANKTLENNDLPNDKPLVKNYNPINKIPVITPVEKIMQENNDKDIAAVPDNIHDKPVKIITGNIEKPMTNELPQDNNMNTTAPDLYAQLTSYTQNNNENYVFYNVTAEVFNKTRIGGFLKKLKRNIVRRSPFNHNNDPEITQQ